MSARPPERAVRFFGATNGAFFKKNFDREHELDQPPRPGGQGARSSLVGRPSVQRGRLPGPSRGATYPAACQSAYRMATLLNHTRGGLSPLTRSKP